MSPDERDELTAAAIGRLAGVGRAAVSNWRRRYPEFPRPVGGSQTSPTFSRAEVEAWLVATGKADQLATAGRNETGIQHIAATSRSPNGLFDDRFPSTHATRHERGIADLTTGQLLARVMVSLLPRSTAASRLVGTDDTGTPVVLDPACSDGTLLMAVADRFGDQIRLVGQEIQESAADVASQSLRGSPYNPPYEIQVGDSLLDNQLAEYLGRAAAVVCEPPFDLPQWPSAELTTDPRWEFGIPAPRDGELAWTQHCYAHLRPRGVAVVAMSPRSCVQLSGQYIRAALVRSGALRDVIALPKGMGTVPDSDVCLWVLQRPYGAPDHPAVRMVDLSRLGDPADVPLDFAAWQRLLDEADPTISRAVPRLELLDGGVNLLPTRYIAARVEASANDLARVSSRLQALYGHVSRGLPGFTAPKAPTSHSYATLGELERVGAVTFRSRDITPRRGDLLLRTLSRPPAVASGTATDDAGVAQVVELDVSRLDAQFVATFLRTDANTLPVANTLGTLSRDDLRRCRIPRMSLAEQRRYGDAFRYLQELQDVLAGLAKVGTGLIEQAVYGLTTGALAPDFPTARNTYDADHASDETREL